jgi:hypothetical protein
MTLKHPHIFQQHTLYLCHFAEVSHFHTAHIYIYTHTMGNRHWGKSFPLWRTSFRLTCTPFYPHRFRIVAVRCDMTVHWKVPRPFSQLGYTRGFTPRPSLRRFQSRNPEPGSSIWFLVRFKSLTWLLNSFRKLFEFGIIFSVQRSV